MKLDSATVQREVMATESKDEQPAQSNMVIGGDALQTVAILDATASLVETAGALFRVLHSTDKQPKVCQNVIEDIHEVRNPNDVEGTMAGKSRTTIPHILNEGKQTVSKSFVSEESRKASQMGNEVLLVPAVSEEVSIPSHPAALLEHHEVSPALTESSKTLDSLKNSFTTPESEGLVAQAFICNESNLATSYLSTWECLLDYIRAVHGASAAILEVPGIGISYLHRIKSLHDTCELVRIKCELPNNRSTNNEQLYVFKRADQGLLGNTDNMRREIGLFLTMPLHENIMKIDYLVTRRLVGQLTTKITQGEIRNGQSCITECEKGDVICGFLTKYIPTGTLGRTLRRRCAEGSFYWSIRMSWALQLCDAFYHIHHVAKTYHGGCKPDNILIDDRDGKGGKLIVIDFEHLKSTKLFRSRWLTYYYTTPDDRMYNDVSEKGNPTSVSRITNSFNTS